MMVNCLKSSTERYGHLTQFNDRTERLHINQDSEYVPFLSIINNLTPVSVANKINHIPKVQKLDVNESYFNRMLYNKALLSEGNYKMAFEMSLNTLLTNFRTQIILNTMTGYQSSLYAFTRDYCHVSRIYDNFRQYLIGGYFCMDKNNKRILYSLMVPRSEIFSTLRDFILNKDTDVSNFQFWIQEDMFNGLVKYTKTLTVLKDILPACEVKVVSDFKSVFSKNPPEGLGIKEQKEYCADVLQQFFDQMPERRGLRVSSSAVDTVELPF